MTLAQLYRDRVRTGLISADTDQLAAVELLGVLENRLRGWEPRRARFLFGRPEPAPRGLYLFGGVGRGKSMLMDLFFETAAVPRKRRVHFHAFMSEVHAAIAEWRAMEPSERRRHPGFVKGAGDDPIAPVASRIAQDSWLLCFDELQVTDIADAMILGRLFEQLLARQVVVVATSNRHPRDLYRDGINRQLFVPFIAMLEEALDLHALEGGRDWRLAQLEAQGVYHTPLGPAARAAMDRTWDALTQRAQPRPTPLDVQGRIVVAPRTAAGCARFDFEELCARPLGPVDYLALAARFDTLLVDDIPRMGPERREEAARFRTLVDALYEAGTRLVLSAADEPDGLYPQGSMAFEFERTASRLHEMRSGAWLASARANARG